MQLKNNFQRHIVLDLLFIFNYLCLAFIFLILKYYYNISFFHFILVGILFGLYYCFYWADSSKVIFNKYCNKECHNCAMWHCDLHYKDGKYIK